MDREKFVKVDIDPALLGPEEMRPALEKAVEELRFWKSNFWQLAENKRCGYSIMDNKGTYVYFSQSVFEMLGLNEELVSCNSGTDLIPLFMHPDDIGPAGARAMEAVTSGKKNRMDFRFRRIGSKEEGWRWASQEAFPWYGPDGEILGVMAESWDVTDELIEREQRDRLQKQLLHSQKMEAIGTLAGGIAHDFNNLLTIIMLSAESAANSLGGEDGGSKKMLDRIIGSTERAKKLARSLLAFARKASPESRVLETNQIVRDMVELLEKGTLKNVAVKPELDPGSLEVFADPAQIEQALMNICNNALDAMPNGGELTLRTGRIELDADQCANRPDLVPGEYCSIEVIDTGVGMDEATRQKIFEPFFTTKERGKGTGLGLSLCHGVIRSHGGGIDVESAPGQGTRFQALLPLATEEAVSKLMEDTAEVAGGNETILVVDDEEFISEVTAMILEKVGYRVLRSTSGLEAMEQFAENGDEIDLVILDMVMPEMYGDEAYRRIKEIKPQQKFVVFSGYSVKGRLEKMDIHGFVQKPFGSRELFAAVRRALDS